MAVFRTVIRSDLQKPLVVQQLSGNMFTADNASNEIAVEVTNGGEPVALSGAVTAYAVRADGVTAMFSGTISGNVASVILPASCYVEVGTLSIVVKVGSTTVGACTCYVYRTTTDEIVDPGHVIPSIEELLEQIEACRTATTNANTAASSANTAATNANTKAGQAETAAGNANTAAGKINNMTVAATTLPAGSQATVSVKEVSGHKHIIFGLPKGESGNETIDDTAGAGDTDKVWSADKSTKEVTDLKSAINDTDDVLLGFLGTLSRTNVAVPKGSTRKELLTFDLTSGNIITIDIKLHSALSVNTYLYLQTENGTDLFPGTSRSISSGSTTFTYSYTPSADNKNCKLQYTIASSATTDALFDYVKITAQNSTYAADLANAYKNVINSIPNDYTGIVIGKDELAFIPLEVGNIDISGSGWTYNNNTLRCRLQENYAVYLFKGDILSSSSYTNFRFYVGWKKDNGTYGYNGWNTSDYTVTEDGFYVFTLATIDGTKLNLDTAKTLFSITRKKGIIDKIKDSADTVTEFIGTPMTGILPTTLGNYYPEISTADQTFTLWNDSILFDKRLNSNGFVAVSSKQVVSYASIASTAVAFWWDIANSTVVADRYNAVKDTSKYLLLALFRKNKSAISASFPVFIDGKINGTFDPSAINSVINDKLWENNVVKSINHRGYLNVAPENTLPAFQMSKEKGYKYVETDVQFTSDNVAVLLHDTSINRTARNDDGTELSSTVYIADITYEQALQYDFGIWKGTAYAGTRIPTFEEFIVACKRLGVHPYIEMKVGTESQIASLYNTVKKCGMIGNVTWISYNTTLLGYITALDEKERIGYLASSISATTIGNASALKTGKNEVFFDADSISAITDAGVDLLVSAGMPLEVFTFGTTNILSLNNYVSGITNNDDNVGKILYENYNTQSE